MPDVFQVLGGLGLFLIGMAVMRDGLKKLVDQAATKWMTLFTRTPVLAALTGFVVTVLLQSSSAVSVMTIGFVGAGLLSFPRALGVILGANVGSTVTGWLVALIGFKFDLQTITLPLIFVGAMLRLFGRPKFASLGFTLAGFGLVFSGVAALQLGLQGVDRLITPEIFPGDTWLGRFLLLLLGLGITLVTHSSAVGVAVAIAAVHVGSLSLTQAAAMVIGMDIGTTATAALATIGATVNARRTGFAHVLFNLLTGLGAFLALPIIVQSLERFAPRWTAANPELALVGFHSTFNIVGVALMLPFASRFARTVEWLIPQRNGLTLRLEHSLLAQPRLALTNVRATLEEISSRCAVICRNLLTTSSSEELEGELSECQIGLDETRQYLEKIPRSSVDPETWPQHVDCLHVVDHLARLLVRMRKSDRAESVRRKEDLRQRGQALVEALSMDLSVEGNKSLFAAKLKSTSTELDETLASHRQLTVEQTALGKVSTTEALAILDGFRWLRRVSFHFQRIAEHLFAIPLESKVTAVPSTRSEEEPPDMD